MLMGSCFSSGYTTSSVSPSIAKVITANGNLHEYSVPVTVSQVLDEVVVETGSSCFLCNSDSLFYDDYIPALDQEEQLQVGQIYFLLPVSRLHYRLSASDMANLAVRASSALAPQSSKYGGRARGSKVGISPPAVLMHMPERVEYAYDGLKSDKNEPSLSLEISKSESVSVKRLKKKNASRPNKMTLGSSFRVRLSTIYEGSVAG